MNARATFMLFVGAALALSACATPARMHDDAQLNQVALGCGLALGELLQDESEKRLLLLVHQDPNASQRLCVAKWAKRNGLKAVFINAAPGAPLPDLVRINGTADMRFVSFSTRAQGPLTAEFGVPENTAGQCIIVQTGLLALPAVGKAIVPDLFPVEDINLRPLRR